MSVAAQVEYPGAMPAHTVLLVEDDEALAQLVREYLEQHDLRVHVEPRGDQAEAAVQRLKPDALILDIGLPGEDGLSLCRRLRPRFAGPIIMLTARGDEVDEVVGLELGADDYIAKPVRPRVLLARLARLIRRGASATASGLLERGDLRIDSASRSVQLAGREIELTTAEFDLLYVLANNAGQVMSRDAIMEAVRGIAYDGLDRSIDLRISRLRKKLGNPGWIKSVRGVGYLLAVPS